jgi:hypothetical protein
MTAFVYIFNAMLGGLAGGLAVSGFVRILRGDVLFGLGCIAVGALAFGLAVLIEKAND